MSAPSTAAVSPVAKVTYAWDLFREHLDAARDQHDLHDLANDVEEYRALLSGHSGLALENARVLEIGYGARPYRLLSMRSARVDVIGIDAERPALTGSLSELRAILRDNGFERAAKTAVRSALFDRPERRAFQASLVARGLRPVIEPERFLVGDAAALDLPAGSIDLIYSEDVFEHISRASLERLVPKMARWLDQGGLALIRPNIFTGITGGHELEWNRRSFRTGRSKRLGEPWAHLTTEQHRVNTHLNRLSRAAYRELFERHFNIEEERVKLPDLGRQFLTAQLREQLAGYSDDELFSNQVLFILTKSSS